MEIAIIFEANKNHLEELKRANTNCQTVLATIDVFESGSIKKISLKWQKEPQSDFATLKRKTSFDAKFSC